MKYGYFFAFCIGCTLFGNTASAQLVGDNAFLQGTWLEACIAPNGSWGNTMPVPAGYTSRTGSSLSYTDPITGVTPAGNGLDFSYDQGHDGFAVGTPPWYGAYFLPGTPFDGWSVQLDDTMSSSFYSSGRFDTTLGGIFGGTVTGYTGPSCWSPHAAATGIWQGTVGLHRAGMRNALKITQVNEVDPFASWLIVTTKFYNTTDSVLKGVYYFASGDPDNDEDLPGGSFPTNNHINYQGGPFDRHEVSARPPSIHQDAFSGLATQDCRAKVLIYASWPPSMSTGNDLDLVYAGTPTGMGATYYALGATTLSEDIAYGLVFNVGNIAPKDSAFISFAWVFSDTTAVDSIFTTVPQLSTEGALHTPAQPDSVFGCTLAGCGVTGTKFTADIVNGENRKWSFSNWNWTPAIGLSSTTGRHVTCDISLLAGPVTYTSTGTPDVTRGSCNPPAPVTFTMYVQPCFSASSNIPCLNDTLYLIGTGDTTGATFDWSGPMGYTGTGESTYRFPLAMADTGIYRLIKTVGTHHDTTYTDVKIKPIPVVTAGVNTICSGDVLLLTATPDSLGETFAWTGPNGFISVLQNPSIPGAPVMDAGLYRVITTWNGCVDTGFVIAKIDSTPAVPSVVTPLPVCSQAGIVFLTSGDATPGVSYKWKGPNGYTSTLENPVLFGLPTAATGVYTVTAFIVYTGPDLICSDSNTVNVVVDSTPITAVLTSNSPICSGNALNLTATSSTGALYSWIGPDAFSTTVQNPTINPVTTAATGIYTVTATSVYISIVPAYTLTCTSNPLATINVVVDSTPVAPTVSSNSPGFPGISICQGDTLKLYGSDASGHVAFIWTGPNSFLSTIDNPIITPVSPAATGVYTATAEFIYTMPALTCSAASTTYVSITPTPPLTASSNSPVCSSDTLFLLANSDPGAAYFWSGPYTFSSTLQNPSRLSARTEYSGIYQVYAIVRGCPTLTINDTVIINQTPPAPWVKWLTYCQYYPPSPLQAFGDNVTWYTTSVLPATSSKVPPIPATDNVGQTFYFASQTEKGCTSAIDSILVSVYPKPVISVSASVGICPHDSAIIKVTNTDPLAYYHWFPPLYLNDTSSGTVVTFAENDINYLVVASNQYGCTDTARVSVKVNSGAVLTMPDSITLHPGQVYQISPQTNCDYFSWFPSAGLDNPYGSNPIANPLVSTKYIVNATTEAGCKIVDSIVITVDPQTLLALPNAFTPGTGPNSEFKIIKEGIATLNSFNIFDRWGILVFSTSNIDKGWDGTYKGVPQPFDVYVYEINAVTSAGKPFIKKGNVTLIR
jgi:gliding motility-associated-like protein